MKTNEFSKEFTVIRIKEGAEKRKKPEGGAKRVTVTLSVNTDYHGFPDATRTCNIFYEPSRVKDIREMPMMAGLQFFKCVVVELESFGGPTYLYTDVPCYGKTSEEIRELMDKEDASIEAHKDALAKQKLKEMEEKDKKRQEEVRKQQLIKWGLMKP